MLPARTRRAVLLFLILLTIVVFARLVSSAEGAAPSRSPGAAPAVRTGPRAWALRLEEPGALLAGGSTLQRTLALVGARPGPAGVEVGWAVRIDGAVAARGREVLGSRGGGTRVVLSIPVPPVDRPSGLDLTVEAREEGAPAGEASFPFVVYPRETGRTIARLFDRARAALYDPEGGAGPALAALGLRFDAFGSFEGLALYEGDLIVIGPGGFSRGRDGLGPILAARARSGTRLLLLEQPTLPATLSEDLRLWPSFTGSFDSSTLIAARHPVLRGLAGLDPAAPAAARGAGIRPLLPPARGNFRVIAETRTRTGPAWQEGVTLLELPMGPGTVLAAQSPLCSDFARDPSARLLLANVLVYLLGERRGLKKSFVYGASLEDLPACLARLDPGVTRVPADFAETEALLVAGDWRAPRAAAAAGLPPVADVARYLRDGGTVLLLNPQPLSLDYLRAVVGAPLYFAAAAAAATRLDPEAPLLEGIAMEDLGLIGRAGPAEIRLRSLPGRVEVEPLVLVPGIAQYRVGRGVLVALSLPDAADCATPRVSSLLARLLTNLGVPLGRSPGLDPGAVSLLDE